MVIVVATDVRDRLFLFDQLRQRLPSAMLIDLESDILLAHPDFLHASRGAVTVASANLFVRWGRLFGCETRRSRASPANRIRVPLASWALDGQGILANAVSRLYDSGQTPTAQPCILDDNDEKFGPRAPVLHVVTLKGLRRISRVVDLPARARERKRTNWQKHAKPGRETSPSASGCRCSVASRSCCPGSGSGRCEKRTRPVLTLAPWEITLCAGVAGAVIWTFAMLAAYCGRRSRERLCARVLVAGDPVDRRRRPAPMPEARARRQVRPSKDLPEAASLRHRRHRVVCVCARGCAADRRLSTPGVRIRRGG